MDGIRSKTSGSTPFEMNNGVRIKRPMSQRGFTFIEIMLVLAIASLLALGLLSQYTINQRRARFTDAVERLVATMERVKTEVNSAYTTGEGTSEDEIFFGKAIEFIDGTDTYTVQTLVADFDAPAQIRLKGFPVTAKLPWRVKLESPRCNAYPNCHVVVFVKEPTDGRLNTYIAANPGTITGYNDKALATIGIESPDGLRAYIVVDADSGEISRVYSN